MKDENKGKRQKAKGKNEDKEQRLNVFSFILPYSLYFAFCLLPFAFIGQRP
jgi:hypothetical protein